MFRLLKRDDGFTLIELMVVVLILAILLALGVPSYLGFRARAYDNAAKASLTTAEKVGSLVYLEDGAFPGDAALLVRFPLEEPQMTWVAGGTAVTGHEQISLDEDAAGTELAMATYSQTGTCFYLRMVAGSPTERHMVEDAATCRAADFTDGAGAGW